MKNLTDSAMILHDIRFQELRISRDESERFDMWEEYDRAVAAQFDPDCPFYDPLGDFWRHMESV